MTPDQRLEYYLDNGPEWLRHAYLNCAATNRVMKECAHKGYGTEAMCYAVAGRLYELKNAWAGTAMNYAKAHGTIRPGGEIPVIPS